MRPTLTRHDTGRAEPPARQQTPRRRRRATRWMLLLELLVATLLLIASTAPTASAETTQVLAAVAGDVNTVLTNIRNWLMGILALVATVFLTIGGVRYVMAGGDPSEVERAKVAFKSAGIGYGLAALAPVAVEVLKQIVGA